MNMILNITDYLLSIARMIIIVHFIMSILVSFNVINTYNDFVRGLLEALDRITAPIYRPIRRIMPDLGPIDFTPMVVLIIIAIVQNFILPELRF
jgi:YggT family protein